MKTDSLNEETLGWQPLKPVLAVLAAAETEDWTWLANSRCKYIELRIDMRGFGCIIRDRDGQPITLEQLQFQYGKGPA